MRACRLVLISLIVTFATITPAKPIRIAVASNFSHTLETITDAYLDSNPKTQIELIPGSTGKLYLQIAAGAPYDIFYAADTERPRLLEEQGHIQANGRLAYAEGVLTLWTRNDWLENKNGLEALLGGDFEKLAIANPKVAPFGAASIEMLVHFNLYENLKDKLVYGENVSQPYHFAKTGAADFALLSYASVHSTPNAAGSYWLPPQESYSQILQEVVLISEQEEARSFFEFTQSETAKQIIEADGYRIP